MSWSMRRTLTLGLSLAIGVLAINALVTFWNIRTLISSGQWVIHTREVLNELDELFATVQDVEAAHRGFLLTGDESYLKRAEPAAASLPSRLDHLRAITSDNSRQQTRLPLLERQVRSRLDLLLADDALRRERGLDASIRSLADGRGQQASTELRSTLETVKHEEESLLTRRTRAAESSVWWTVGSFSLASLLAIGLLGTTCYSFWKEAYIRQRLGPDDPPVRGARGGDPGILARRHHRHGSPRACGRVQPGGGADLRLRASRDPRRRDGRV